ESLVSRGQQEYEDQVNELRENDGPPETDIRVTVDYARPEVPPLVEGEEVDQEFAFVHHLDASRKIPGTEPYLDDVERQNAEVQRARVEDREPDLVNPPASTGTPLQDVRSLR